MFEISESKTKIPQRGGKKQNKTEKQLMLILLFVLSTLVQYHGDLFKLTTRDATVSF